MKKIIAAIACLMASVGVHAASLDLIYTGSNEQVNDGEIVAAAGDILTFDIFLNFTDTPTLGGGFNVLFTQSELGFLEYNNAGLGEPSFGRDPDIEDGRLFSAAVGAFGGLSSGLIAEVSFEVLGDGAFSIELEETAGLGGPWISAVDFVTPIDVEYGRVERALMPVPVPAALWLMLGGLGTLIRFCRR